MQIVTVNKDELLDILRKNMATHIDDYAESVDDYKEAVINIAKKNLELVESGDLGTIAKTAEFPRAPRTYEKSYSKSIRKLELSVDDTITLEDHEFTELVLDEWDWKRSFTSAKELYMSMKG